MNFQGAQIAFIGSSLIQYGVPSSGGGESSVLGDNRSHLRIGTPGARASEIEGQFEDALEGGAETVFLELRPFLYVNAGEWSRKLCGDFICSAFQTISVQRDNLRDGYRNLAGAKSWSQELVQRGLLEPPDLDQPFALDQKLEDTYPLNFLARDPSDRLQKLVARARQNGTQVVLFLMPRAPTASEFIGHAQEAELEERASHYARALDLPLFVPPLELQDSDFIDNAHMSRQGREKFLVQLQAWWAAQI